MACVRVGMPPLPTLFSACPPSSPHAQHNPLCAATPASLSLHGPCDASNTFAHMHTFARCPAPHRNSNANRVPSGGWAMICAHARLPHCMRAPTVCAHAMHYACSVMHVHVHVLSVGVPAARCAGSDEEGGGARGQAESVAALLSAAALQPRRFLAAWPREFPCRPPNPRCCRSQPATRMHHEDDDDGAGACLPALSVFVLHSRLPQCRRKRWTSRHPCCASRF